MKAVLSFRADTRDARAATHRVQPIGVARDSWTFLFLAGGK
jgi:hypothetical protein